MKARIWNSVVLTVAMAVIALPVMAHFQVILPSPDMVTADGSRTIELSFVFTHPMEQGPTMNMGEPAQVGVLVMGQTQDLKQALQVKPVDGVNTYTAAYKVKAPGDHIFYIEPAPYWEPAEEKMIIHYTKVVVNAFGEEEGWDATVGFPVEIEPLVRPYGLWTGNIFRGIVKKGGQPVPFAEIEVEYYNEGSAVPIPADAFVTQVIKADANGVFSYAMPKAGWWGFAALIDGDEQMQNPEGSMVDVELGALIWIKTISME
jgi:cobalt/nickel transport protein